MKRFVIEFSYSGKSKMRREEKNIEINSKYHQEKILWPIFTEDIPFHYANEFHRGKLH